jgi:plastocyanin
LDGSLMTKSSLGVSRRVSFALFAAAVAGLAAAPRADAPASALAPAGATARLTGMVTVTAAARAPLASAAYASRRVAAPSAAPASELANVVVFLKGASFDGPLPAMHEKIVQEDEAFVPRLVAVTRGSLIDFPNLDPYFHDVFSLSDAAAFDLGSYPRGKSRSRRFTKPGLVKVYCHLHSHMTASIMVFDHPYFAIPAADGSFTIDGLPPGHYTVSAWHERIGESSQGITLEPGGTTDVRFSLPVVQQ